MRKLDIITFITAAVSLIAYIVFVVLYALGMITGIECVVSAMTFITLDLSLLTVRNAIDLQKYRNRQ